jgi:TolB-like protein
VSTDRSPRRDFRVLTRRRGGYDGAVMIDVQLQVAESGALVWAQTFSDDAQAEDFQRQLEEDLDALDDATFRRKYSVPSSA